MHDVVSPVLALIPIPFDLGWVRDRFQDLARVMVAGIFAILRDSPEPNLLSAWYRGQFNLVLSITGYVTIVIVLLSTVAAVLKGGLKELLRTYLVGIPVAVFGGVAAIAMVVLLQKISQDATSAVLDASQASFSGYYDQVNGSQNPFSLYGDTGGVMLDLLTLMGVSIGIIVVQVELVFRQIMIYVSCMFIPLALAAFVWTPLRGWFSALAEMVVVAVLSKFIIASVLGFGLVAAQHSGDSGAWFRLFGLMTIFVACVAVPALIGFVLQPRHAQISGTQLRAATPLGADRRYARSRVREHIGNGIKGLKK